MAMKQIIALAVLNLKCHLVCLDHTDGIEYQEDIVPFKVVLLRRLSPLVVLMNAIYTLTQASRVQ